jgi:glycosyltransferase involved in cell wall biosynthesis
MNDIYADVSVLSANYNNGRYLRLFFDSILSSTLIPKEIVIVDDGSSDDSRAIIHEYASRYESIRYLLLDQNVGFANALNAGLDLAGSKYIMRLDPDDCVHPDRIRQQYEMLEEHSDIDIVGSNAFYFEGELSDVQFKTNFPGPHELIIRQYKRGVHGILHGSVMCRAAVFKKYKYQQEYVPAEDFVLFAQMIADGHKALNIKEALTYVRVHSGSVSNDLSFKAIQVPFLVSNQLFHMNHGPWKIKIFYFHLKYYRKFLFSKNIPEKLWYLTLAVILQPGKVMARIKQ